MNNFANLAMRYKLNRNIIIFMNILETRKKLGNNKHSHIYEYLDNYPDLLNLSEYEFQYLIDDFLQKNKNYQTQTQTHKKVLVLTMEIFSDLPEDHKISIMLNEYKKYPSKETILDILSVIDTFVERKE